MAAKRKWKLSNTGRVNADTAKRFATKMNAVPKWADAVAIRVLYQFAKALVLTTGRQWHVDHIVPLRSQFVCGLHTVANLRIIPGRDNMLKGNRSWPDMA